MRKVKQKTIMLIISQQCNLSCNYCYEFHQANCLMSPDVAKKLIDQEFADKSYDSFMIQLFGGEPFINVDVIKQIYEYTSQKYPNLNFHIFIMTNGTLITPAMEEWLAARKNHITLGLSLDGTREMHNFNRSNSFDRINLDFFVKNYPHQPVKMTISNETLPNMAEGIIFMTRKGFQVSASFAQGIAYDKNSEKILVREFEKLLTFYLNNPEYPIPDLIDANLEQLAITSSEESDKWCGCGKDLIAYEPDGTQYPCQLFSSISLGEAAKAFEYKDEDYLRGMSKGFRDPKCVECHFKKICPHCCGISFLMNNNLAKRDDTICKFYKIRFYFSALFKFRKFFENRSIDKPLTEFEYYLLKGIEKTQALTENLSKFR